MVYSNFVNGQVLTAGSLLGFRQYYGSASTGTPASGTTYADLGSIYVSGGVIGRELHVQYQTGASTSETAASIVTRLFLSGAGLSGGSELATKSVTSNGGGLGTTKVGTLGNYVVVVSGAGWIPASGAYLYLQGYVAGDAGGGSAHNNVLVVYGIG